MEPKISTTEELKMQQEKNDNIEAFAECRNSAKNFLREYLNLNSKSFDKVKLLNNEEIGQRYKEQYGFLEDERLKNITIAVVSDDLWHKSQPTESNAQNHVILIKESYYNEQDLEDEAAWFTHELAHYQIFVEMDDVDKYEQSMKEIAFDGIESEYAYPNNIVEKYTFKKQFQYLKKEGKARNDIVILLMKYYEIDDMKFFDKILNEVY